MDNSGVAVEGKAGLCNSKCGYCGGSPVSRQASSKPCGYNCLVNPDKAMKPLTTMDPSLLSPPTVSENPDDPLLPFNKKPVNMFQFNIDDPGVFLRCENGFNHFPCERNLFVKCTGKYSFTAHEVNCPDNAIIGEKIKVNVENSHFGCGPCPLGFNYLKGYESRTYSTSLGGYYNVPTINDCRSKCDKLGCFTFAYSPTSRSCKLHSVRRVALSKPVYKDYRICVKEENDACKTALNNKLEQDAPPPIPNKDYKCINAAEGKWYWTTKVCESEGKEFEVDPNLQTNIDFFNLMTDSSITSTQSRLRWANRCNRQFLGKPPYSETNTLVESTSTWNTGTNAEKLAKASIILLDFLSHQETGEKENVHCPQMSSQTLAMAIIKDVNDDTNAFDIFIAGNMNIPFNKNNPEDSSYLNSRLGKIHNIVRAEFAGLRDIFILYPDATTFGGKAGTSFHHAEMQIVKYFSANQPSKKISFMGVSKPPCCNCNTVLRRVKADLTNAYEAGLYKGQIISANLEYNNKDPTACGTDLTKCSGIPELLKDVPVASGKGSDKCETKDDPPLKYWCGSQYYAQGGIAGLPGTE